MKSNQHRTKPKHHYTRWTFTAIAFAILIVSWLAAAVYLWRSPTTDVIPDLPDNAFMRTVVDLALDQAKTALQALGILTAAICGEAIVNRKETQLGLTDYPEMIMCAITFILLLSSFLFYLAYLARVQGALLSAAMTNDSAHPSMPNIFSPSIVSRYYLQLGFLAAGTVVTGLSLFSVHKLKKKPEPQTA